ncbi:IPExxxVDY family protein [uncultured Flavobacterium sp.]|uniref:IPExxxVDY family protein n=1 Tax=uncultured Flavobacterium sp. TaxID=165435 RepID=UPI0025ED8438|nr:IPExxxVDY family protein [uncultured Flavobacterium sp.]
MAIHKLLIDDFITIDYGLIAIHSSLEDYRLAYFVNRALSVLLEKSADDIGVAISEGESHFSRFVYEDANETMWSLVQNKNSVVSTQVTGSLFGPSGIDVATSVFLVPELKKVDYILKIENTPDVFALDTIVEKLVSVKYVTTAYTIDHHKLKSKNNLIF